MMDSFSPETQTKMEDDEPIPSTSTHDFNPINDQLHNFQEQISFIPDQMMDSFSQETQTKMEGDESNPSKIQPGQRIRRKKQRREKLSFKPYILRIKKIVTPKMKLSSNALEDLDNLLSNVYEMYCSEFQLLSSHTKKKTLTAKDVESATKLCIPGKLKDNAIKNASGFK
ncbi:hypothetical protein AVEN_264165-1 [Araneus ventricosus]|uniref:Core Histone H2A/H2B/H3 domain-containing protein n=1 Tax=Araneus ventricosus TaxID=182803 RepID=A0A4Y2W5P7_ARAVE|nr:hypothetical protein AVEN_264165-1 [Araneus ventricosus]